MNQNDFSYYDLNISRGYAANEIHVSGEVKNNSSVNYSTVVFRVTLYIQNKIAGSGTMKVAGLQAKGSRSFEARVEGLGEVDEKTISRISRCEILFENGY